MYQQLEEISESILAFKIHNEITDNEMDQISRIMEDKIAAAGKIRLLLIIENLRSMNSAESLYEELRFAKIYAEDIECMAVVGDKSWKKPWVALFSLFSNIPAEYFDRSELESAKRWLLDR